MRAPTWSPTRTRGRRGGRPAVGHRALPAAGRLHGVRIGHVLETHNHADHVSGHGRLARATGATIHIHELAEAEYPHEPFADGWRLAPRASSDRGDPHARPPARAHLASCSATWARRRVPGRSSPATPSSSAMSRRPDLAVEPREGAAEMFRSLHERLLSSRRRSRGLAGPPRRLALRRLRDRPEALLDDRLRAPPQRAPWRSPEAGSFVEAPARLARRAAAERRADRRPEPRAAGRGARHAGAADPARGRGGGRRGRGRWSTPARTSSSTRRTSPARSAPPPTTPDSRPRSRGWSTEDAELIVVAASDGYELEAAELLASVGLRVRGFLEGGMTAWRSEERPVERIELIDPDGLAERLAATATGSSCSTSATATSSRAGTSPARVHIPYGAARRSPRRAARGTGRSRRSAAAASAAGSPPRSSSARGSSR